jgi:hypothetical protein
VRAEFRRALEAASEQRDAGGRISVIKRAVTNEIRAADPSVSIIFTDYFNHSFAPDMVLRWPTENRERLLFVRPSASMNWLLGGLQFVASHRSLVFTLEDLPPAPPTDSPDRTRRVLAENATATDTWITDPSGLAAVSSVRTNEPALGLLSQALVRGGRGVSGGDEVTALTGATVAGLPVLASFPNRVLARLSRQLKATLMTNNQVG